MEEILIKQRSFFESGKTRSLCFRISVLKRLKESINKNEDLLFEALTKDLKKCGFEAYSTEVGLVLNDIDYMIKNLYKFSRIKEVKTPLLYFGGRSFIVPEPYGNVLIISPWNYPFQLTMSPLIGAIAAGNCAIVKPSKYSRETSKVIFKIIKECFDEEYIYCIDSNSIESSKLLEYRFDYIFFTGSPSIGKEVMKAASKFLTPVTLELGGKSPAIVEDDSKLDYAARRIAWGKFINCGQTCVAPDYILVNKNVKKEFLELLVKNIEAFFGKDQSKSPYYGRIINEKHFDRLISLINSEKVHYGGNQDRESLYIQPTIIKDLEKSNPLMEDEIFGPILPIIEYEDLNQAIGYINSHEKPLALYFFTECRKKIDTIVEKTSSGGVCINDTLIHMTTQYLPFGGVGQSGMGKYHGFESFNTFSHKKSVLKNQTKFEINLKFPPYKISIEKLKKLMKRL